MTKNKEFEKVLGILEDVYGWNDTNELTEIQQELVNDVISVVKKLTIPDVVGSYDDMTFAELSKIRNERILDLRYIEKKMKKIAIAIGKSTAGGGNYKH